MKSDKTWCMATKISHRNHIEMTNFKRKGDKFQSSSKQQQWIRKSKICKGTFSIPGHQLSHQHLPRSLMSLNARMKVKMCGDLQVEDGTCVIMASRHNSTSSLTLVVMLLFFFIIFFFFFSLSGSATIFTDGLSSSSCCSPFKAPAEWEEGGGEVPRTQKGKGSKGQPFSLHFLYC